MKIDTSSSKTIVSNIDGCWSGQLNIGTLLTIIIYIEKKSADEYRAKLDCLEQRITDIPVDKMIFDGQSLIFEIKQLVAIYEGLINKDGTEISGTYKQGGISFPLILKHCKTVPKKIKRPQEPKPPYPYFEEEVLFENKASNLILSGTLTLPHTKGPFPGVLLIAGSGPNDRNETLMGHKPFMVLADHLTRHGIAVLRFDKRGVGKSTGNYDTATSEDFASDVQAGVQYLKNGKKRCIKNIGLIGHSEGGIIASMVTAQSQDVDFVVLMAAPGVNGEEILYEQGMLLQRAEGISEKIISCDLILRQKAFSIVKREPDPKLAEKQLMDAIDTYWITLPKTYKKEVNRPIIETNIKKINSPWFRYFIAFDPATVIKKITVPILVLNGQLDLQVSAQQNLPAIAKALTVGKNNSYTLMEIPKLNHLFQTCTTGKMSEYAKIEETIAPIALNTISEWILNSFSP